MLRAGLPPDALAGVRLAASAGEALPAALYQRWTSHFGVDILDGIGMTEMLHIFLSNRPGQVKAGTTGVAVPGYDLRVLGEDGLQVPPGTPGTLFVRGESAATGYWSRYAASRQVFQGEWLRTGDTYVVDADGYYACLGRTGDMLKASGIWVSPGRGGITPARARRGRPGGGGGRERRRRPGEAGRLRPAQSRRPGRRADPDRVLPDSACPSFKRPRRIVFVTEYPTTATGKIRRVELRAQAAAILQALQSRAAREARFPGSRPPEATGGALCPTSSSDRSAPIAVIGAGTMGAGIAQVAAVAGHPVLVYDAVPGAAERAVGARPRPGRRGWSPRAVSTSTPPGCGWTWPANSTSWRRPGA